MLGRLGDLTQKVVLVGGQAVNFWADYYEPRVLELARSAPFTSKDIDFCGDQKDVRACALRLNGEYRLASMDDHTPNTGIVTFVDDSGSRRVIDFIEQPWPERAGRSPHGPACGDSG